MWYFADDELLPWWSFNVLFKIWISTRVLWFQPGAALGQCDQRVFLEPGHTLRLGFGVSDKGVRGALGGDFGGDDCLSWTSYAAVSASMGVMLPSGVQVEQQSVPACGWLFPQRNIPQERAYWVSITQTFFYNPLNYIQRKAIWTISHWQPFQCPPQPAWEAKQGRWHCWCICCFIHLLLNYSGLFIEIWRIIEKLRVFPYL